MMRGKAACCCGQHSSQMIWLYLAEQMVPCHDHSCDCLIYLLIILLFDQSPSLFQFAIGVHKQVQDLRLSLPKRPKFSHHFLEVTNICISLRTITPNNRF
jgi:hypothetical protein